MLCKNCGCDMEEKKEMGSKESYADDSDIKLGLLDELQDMIGEGMLNKIPKKGAAKVEISIVKPKREMNV